MFKLTKTALVCGLLGLAGGTIHAGEMKVPVSFSGGHEIGRNDFGRPVLLIAAGLGVEPDVFREAFSGVTPSRNGPPSGDEARRNKQALMRVLSPHGITNDRLDQVSNYYRFRRQSGEIWPTADAQAYAVVVDGKIKKIVVTEPGSGYCNPPQATIESMDDVSLTVTLHLDTNLERNGGIEAVEVAQPKVKKTGR
jgi:hypothetical protein